MNARLLFVYTISPLHAGTGQGVGLIDLPIAREKATGLPFLPGSSLKGTLRDACRDEPMCILVFGPDTDHASDFAGSVQFSDQRLLLFPVRSLAGTFAWVTSPYILRRLTRDAEFASIESIPSEVPSPNRKNCVVSDNHSKILIDNKVILEDLDLHPVPEKSVSSWANWIGKHIFPNDTTWQSMLLSRLTVVHDDLFSFLLDTATEITTRIQLLKDSKTVKEGSLWYEEALPAETVLYGLVVSTPVRATKKEVFDTIGSLVSKPLQFGGNTTVGRGLCRLQMTGGNDR